MKKSIAILVFLVLCITIPPILVNAEYTVKPTITTQPKDVSVTAGSTATFKITASGASGYQWYYQKPGDATWNTVKNNGTAAMRHNGYKYRCQLKNTTGSVYTSVVTLRVYPCPTLPPIEKPETTYAPVPTAIATIPPKP